jgi:hypothetical protein
MAKTTIVFEDTAQWSRSAYLKLQDDKIVFDCSDGEYGPIEFPTEQFIRALRYHEAEGDFSDPEVAANWQQIDAELDADPEQQNNVDTNASDVYADLAQQTSPDGLPGYPTQAAAAEFIQSIHFKWPKVEAWIMQHDGRYYPNFNVPE